MNIPGYHREHEKTAEKIISKNKKKYIKISHPDTSENQPQFYLSQHLPSR